MNISRARVQYYRSIVDTGWVNLDTDITTLLGKNESGKSSFLQALASISNDKPIEERDQNYNQRPDETPFEMIRIELAPEDGCDKIQIGPLDIDAPIQVVKLSNGDRKIDAKTDKYSISSPETKKELIEDVTSIGEDLNTLRNENSGKFRKKYDSNVKKNLNNIRNNGGENNLQWNLNQLDSLTSGLETLPDITNDESKNLVEKSKNKLISRYEEAEIISDFDVSSVLPSIVYHDEFDRIKDSVHINSLNESENRTFRNLLNIANIDYDDFNDRDDFEQVRELNSAQVNVSGEVNSIWDQKSVNVSINFSNNKFLIQIADNSLGNGDNKKKIQRELIRPSSRSEGFQWFFSFYTNLTAETNGDNDDKLILLDDPAVVLHPEGKKNWLDAIEQMTDDAQFVYSSHSPYLIRKEYPERIRLVEDLPAEGTKITNKWAEGDSMALKPLRNALGIGLGDSPFASKRQILVEGVTDYYIFTAINNYLKSIGRDFIDADEVSIMPTNGAPNMPNAAKWVASEGFAYVLLLDNDQAGKDAMDEIAEQHQEVDLDRVILLELEDGGNQFYIELEDLFTTEFYIESVNRAYSSQFPDEFSEINLKHDGEENKYSIDGVSYANRKITSKLDEVLKNQKMGDFDKVLVANEIQDRLNSGDANRSDMENFLPIFEKIRRLT